MAKPTRILMLVLVLAGPAAELHGQGAAPFSELTRETLLFPTDAGNVVAVVTSEGVFVVGPVSRSSTGGIQAVISQRTPSPARYVIASPNDLTRDEGDAGWGKLGAVVAAQEKAWGRMWDTSRYAARGAQRPRAARLQDPP